MIGRQYFTHILIRRWAGDPVIKEDPRRGLRWADMNLLD